MPPPERPAIRSTNRAASSNQIPDSPRSHESTTVRPPIGARSTTFEGPTQIHRDTSPSAVPARMARVPSDSLSVRTQRAQLRPTNRVVTGGDVFEDPSDSSTLYSTSSPDKYLGERAASPATSHGSAMSRNGSSSTLNGLSGKKPPPPPPPPSRAKKPPPPPPMKRSALSTSDVRYA